MGVSNNHQMGFFGLCVFILGLLSSKDVLLVVLLKRELRSFVILSREFSNRCDREILECQPILRKTIPTANWSFKFSHFFVILFN